MAFTCGFFNSDRGDRKYNAEQISAIFDGIIADGVFATIGDHMMVTPGTGMQVLVGTGKAWFDHTWNVNDSLYSLEIAKSDVTLDRIDAVVLETNHSDSVRFNGFKVIRGAMSSTPVKPTLTNTETIHQHPLAWIRVKAGATAITASMIENAVGKTECPFVTGVVKVTNIDDIFNQWNGEFDEWFANLKTQLSGDVAANLQRQIDENREAISTSGYYFEDEPVPYADKFHTAETDTEFPIEIYKAVHSYSPRSNSDQRYIYGNTLYVVGDAIVKSVNDPTIIQRIFGYDFENNNKILDIDIGPELSSYIKTTFPHDKTDNASMTIGYGSGCTRETMFWCVQVQMNSSSSVTYKYIMVYLDVNTHQISFSAKEYLPVRSPGNHNLSLYLLEGFNASFLNIMDKTFTRVKSIPSTNIPGVDASYQFDVQRIDGDIVYVALKSSDTSKPKLHYCSKNYGDTWSKLNFPTPNETYWFMYNPIDDLMYFTNNFKSLFSFDGTTLTEINIGIAGTSISNHWSRNFNNTTITIYSTTYSAAPQSSTIYKLINGTLIKIAEIEYPYSLGFSQEFILENGTPIYMDYNTGIVYRGTSSGKKKVFKGAAPYGILYEKYELGRLTPIELFWDTKFISISNENGIAYQIPIDLPKNMLPPTTRWPTSTCMEANRNNEYGYVRGNSRYVTYGGSGELRSDPVDIRIDHQNRLPDRLLVTFTSDCSISLVRMIKKG